MKTRTFGRPGLALHDLLVAMALAMFLFTLLLPGVIRVREQDLSQKCVNNLKQLCLAYNNWRTTMPSTAFRVDNWSESLSPYFENNRDTLHCPAKVPTAAAGPVQILGMTATAKSSWDATQTPASRTVDGSGLSGEPPVHGSEVRHMWLSDGTATAEQWLSLNLGGNFKVGHLQIWNYNQDGKSGRGVKTCDVEVSRDGQTWTVDVPRVSFTSAAGGAGEKSQKVNLPDTPSARHVRISIKSNHGGDNFVGLSEVQVFGSVAFNGPDTDYGMNGYIGTTRRVSNISGTICFLDYNQPVADMTDTMYKVDSCVPGIVDFILPTGVARRHPAPRCVNVGFVDGHVELFSVATIHPAASHPNGFTGADFYWNNGGAHRSD